MYLYMYGRRYLSTAVQAVLKYLRTVLLYISWYLLFYSCSSRAVQPVQRRYLSTQVQHKKSKRRSAGLIPVSHNRTLNKPDYRNYYKKVQQ